MKRFSEFAFLSFFAIFFFFFFRTTLLWLAKGAFDEY
jgi:hypothetical protein